MYKPQNWGISVKICIAFIAICLYKLFIFCACGGTGRRCRLKICWPQGRAGSIPA